jgi:hypothetical protein
MSKKAKKKANKPMSARAYKAALHELDLTVASKKTSKVLGLGVRQCMRMAHGKVKVPRPVELLLQMYRHHGLPADD